MNGRAAADCAAMLQLTQQAAGLFDPILSSEFINMS